MRAVDIINKVLAEELDVISEDKRNAVAEKIAKELKVEKISILHLGDLKGHSGSVSVPVSKEPIAATGSTENFH